MFVSRQGRPLILMEMNARLNNHKQIRVIAIDILDEIRCNSWRLRLDMSFAPSLAGICHLATRMHWGGSIPKHSTSVYTQQIHTEKLNTLFGMSPVAALRFGRFYLLRLPSYWLVDILSTCQSNEASGKCRN